jgi:hypothetical protein
MRVGSDDHTLDEDIAVGYRSAVHGRPDRQAEVREVADDAKVRLLRAEDALMRG